MAIELVIMPVHGMGDTRADFAGKLRKEVGRRLAPAQRDQVHWQPVFYQGVLQPHQRNMMQRMKTQADIDWIRLRRFLLSGFSDAATMESKPQLPNSVYRQVQAIILQALDDAWAAAGGRAVPVIVIAQSLGGQVISNYLWDAQARAPRAGVFQRDRADSIGGRSAHDRFRRFKSLQFLFTTGCNIPIFVAGLDADQIRPVAVAQRGWNFRWENFYDPDDVLGWPLRPINAAYRRAVSADHAINSGGGLGSWLTSWSPMSHTAYWRDDDFLDPLEVAIKGIVPTR